MTGILLAFIINSVNITLPLKTEVPQVKKLMTQAKIGGSKDINKTTKVLPIFSISRTTKLNWETDLYKDTVMCTSDTGEWLYLLVPLRGAGEPNDSFNFEFYRPVFDSTGHQIGDSSKLWLKCKWIFINYDTTGAEKWRAEWYDMQENPYIPYQTQNFTFDPYAYYIAAGIFPEVKTVNNQGDTIKEPTPVSFYPGKWRGIIKTFYHLQDTFPEIALDTTFVLFDDIFPEVNIAGIGDQGEDSQQDSSIFLVAGEETIKINVYENCYADLILHLSYTDSLPAKTTDKEYTINLGNVKNLLKSITLQRVYNFGFRRGREYTLYIEAKDSWENRTISRTVSAPVGPVRITMEIGNKYLWPQIPLANITQEGLSQETIDTITTIHVVAKKIWNLKPVKGLPLTFTIQRIVDDAHPYGDSLDGHYGKLYLCEANCDTIIYPFDTLYTKGTQEGLMLQYRSSEIGQMELLRTKTKDEYYVVYGSGTFQKYLEDTLYIMVPGLVKLEPGKYYQLVGATTYHPENHYGTPYTVDALKKIAVYAHDSLGVDTLYYNDMSLEYGGLFDIGPNYGQLWHTPHKEHRTGKNCDMRPIKGKKGRALKKFISRNFGLFNKLKKDVYNEGNHWHLRLGERD